MKNMTPEERAKATAHTIRDCLNNPIDSTDEWVMAEAIASAIREAEASAFEHGRVAGLKEAEKIAALEHASAVYASTDDPVNQRGWKARAYGAEDILEEIRALIPTPAAAASPSPSADSSSGDRGPTGSGASSTPLRGQRGTRP